MSKARSAEVHVAKRGIIILHRRIDDPDTEITAKMAAHNDLIFSIRRLADGDHLKGRP
jgi:hypothetical protein